MALLYFVYIRYIFLSCQLIHLHKRHKTFILVYIFIQFKCIADLKDIIYRLLRWFQFWVYFNVLQKRPISIKVLVQFNTTHNILHLPLGLLFLWNIFFCLCQTIATFSTISKESSISHKSFLYLSSFDQMGFVLGWQRNTD